MFFYKTYNDFKRYETPTMSRALIACLDREIWVPAGYSTAQRVLEIGCGTGEFLAYLAYKGVRDFVGIDQDEKLAEVIHDDVRDNFCTGNVWHFMEADASAPWDRVALIDVLEHFSASEGADLLCAIATRLAPAGNIIVRVPNAASPWGLQYQHGDLTHRAAYTPSSMRQLAYATGLRCRSVYRQERGGRRRIMTERLLSAVLGWCITETPEIWTSNFYAILERQTPQSQRQHS